MKAMLERLQMAQERNRAKTVEKAGKAEAAMMEANAYPILNLIQHLTHTRNQSPGLYASKRRSVEASKPQASKSLSI